MVETDNMVGDGMDGDGSPQNIYSRHTDVCASRFIILTPLACQMLDYHISKLHSHPTPSVSSLKIAEVHLIEYKCFFDKKAFFA